MRDVIDTLAEGKSILYKTTLPEGLTSEQIVERLKAEPNLTGEIANVPAGGHAASRYLLFFQGRLSRERSSDRMQSDMQKTLAALWEERDRRSREIHEELVTFASIVEKETGRPDERDRVAAVFYNRLPQGHEAAVGPDHHLWHRRRPGGSRPRHHQVRHRDEVALQHLSDQRIAAGADLQSGQDRASGCAASS